MEPRQHPGFQAITEPIWIVGNDDTSTSISAGGLAELALVYLCHHQLRAIEDEKKKARCQGVII